jgi:hypothetical protein
MPLPNVTTVSKTALKEENLGILALLMYCWSEYLISDGGRHPEFFK